VHAIEISLIPPPGYVVSVVEAETARYGLWAHASPDYDITHITTTSHPQRIDVTIFVRSGSVGPEAALALAHKLVSISPAFKNWHIYRQSCP
jgi:hypothetical protein